MNMIKEMEFKFYLNSIIIIYLFEKSFSEV